MRRACGKGCTEFFWTTSERPTRSLEACLTRFGFHTGQKGEQKPERIRNRSCEPSAEAHGGLEHGRWQPDRSLYSRY